MEIVLFLVAFLASLVGGICGIGGGVIIKPVLDLMQIADVATITFLSGCTVLTMSAYSVFRGIVAKECSIDYIISTPLAMGAAVGGVIGKILFQFAKNTAVNPEQVGAWQALGLVAISVLILAYTIFRSKVITLQVQSSLICILIGAALGIMSSFLGIGGGPINLGVFFFFFSMDTKKAAQNSLYIILISQLTSLLTLFLIDTIPVFCASWLMLMICGGLLGGMFAHKICRKIDEQTINHWFVMLQVIIIIISCYNAWKYI